MAIEVALDQQQNIIRVVSQGRINLIVLKQSLAEALTYYNQGYSKVLVNAINQHHGTDTMDIYDFAVAIVDSACDLKQAVVVSPQTTQDVRFLETLVRNRGGLMQIFWDENQALTWLLDDNAKI